MATGAPPAQPAQTPTETSPTSASLSWEGERMFNIYIYDYCLKRGFSKTANQLAEESGIPRESQPPIDARQGLLFEWWSVFWVLFQAKSNGMGSEDSLLYTQHLAQSRHPIAPGQRPPTAGGPPTAPGRFINGMSVPPGSRPPNGQMSNGIGPAGHQPGPPGSQPGQPMPHPGGPHPSNGMPGAQGPPGGQPLHFSQQGQRPPPGPQQQQQQRGPNGAPPFQSPTMAPSPQAQGGQPPQGPGPMGHMGGPSPHMNQLSRNMPPPMGGGPPQGGSAHQTPTQSFQQIPGRPPSRQNTPSQQQQQQHQHQQQQQQHGMNPHPSPSMAPRQPPGPPMDRNMEAQINMEFSRISHDVMGTAKLDVGLGDKEGPALTLDEKRRIIESAKAIRARQAGNAVAGPSGAGMRMPPPNQRNPQQQPQQQPPMQRSAKRNSTSPDEEHQTLPRNDASPPDRKRPRRTPNPADSQPPMTPMGGPFPPQQGPPPGVPQGMPNGMMRHPGGFPPNQQGMPHPPGMNMQLGQGMGPMPMGSNISPMMNHPGPQGMMNSMQPPYQTREQYNRSMAAMHSQKVMPSAALGMLPGAHVGSPSAGGPHDPQNMMRGGPPGPPGPGNRMPQKGPMGGMPPSGMPGGPNKPPQMKQEQHESGPGEQQQGGGPPQGQQGQGGNAPSTPASGPPPGQGPGSNMPTPSPAAILNNPALNPQRPNTGSQPPDPMALFGSTDFMTSMSMPGYELDSTLDFNASALGMEGLFETDLWMNSEEAA